MLQLYTYLCLLGSVFTYIHMDIMEKLNTYRRID